VKDQHFYPVAYTFQEGGNVVQSGTVISGPDADAALAAFRRENPTLLNAWVILQEESAIPGEAVAA